MELIEKELTDSVLGAFYKVYNRLGYGFLESVYCNALAIELERRGHIVQREVGISVEYDGVEIGFYRADFLVDHVLILEIKSTEVLAPHCKRQLINALRASGTRVGLLLHFGPEPAFHRVVNTKGRLAEVKGPPP